MKTIFLLLCNIILCKSADEWDYDDQNGWCDISKSCCGNRQSPVELWESRSYRKVTPFEYINYDVLPKTMTATNDGHSISVTFSGVKPQISGGGLKKTYNLDAIHFHWGVDNYRGSEHTLNDDQAPLELHLVHYDSEYSSLAKAVASKKSDALAVLGVLFWINDRSSNSALNSITTRMKYLKYKDETTNVKPFAFRQLLPKSANTFFRYLGSLTTPNCNEIVIWTVFNKPAFVTNKQMKEFRSTLSTGKNDPKKKTIANNYRYVQKLNGRKVYQYIESGYDEYNYHHNH